MSQNVIRPMVKDIYNKIDKNTSFNDIKTMMLKYMSENELNLSSKEFNIIYTLIIRYTLMKGVKTCQIKI